METIKVGKIVNTRGLRGEVKIVPNTHFIHERFGEGALLYLGEERCEVRVLRSRMEKGLVFAVFEGREDINRVEPFKGADVYADKSDPLLLAEDEVLYSDLMDCDVYTSEAVYVGRVVDVLETGAHAVLRVQRETDSVLIPFVHAIVASLDVDEKRIVIEEMEGLL
mgnify:FL=1